MPTNEILVILPFIEPTNDFICRRNLWAVEVWRNYDIARLGPDCSVFAAAAVCSAYLYYGGLQWQPSLDLSRRNVAISLQAADQRDGSRQLVKLRNIKIDIVYCSSNE